MANGEWNALLSFLRSWIKSQICLKLDFWSLNLHLLVWGYRSDCSFHFVNGSLLLITIYIYKIKKINIFWIYNWIKDLKMTSVSCREVAQLKQRNWKLNFLRLHSQYDKLKCNQLLLTATTITTTTTCLSSPTWLINK